MEDFDPMDGLDLSGLLGSPMPSAQPSAPMAPPQKQGGGWKTLGPLAALIPLAAARGGPDAVAALVAGFQQRQMYGQQQQRQQRQDARADQQLSDAQAYRNAQIENTRRQQQLAFLKQVQTGVEDIEDPDTLARYREAFTNAGRGFGVEAAAIDAITNIPVTRMQKRAAEKRIAALKSQHGDKWMEMGARFLHELPGGERVPFDELQRRAGYVADPNAPPIAPVAPKDKRGFQRTEALVNGQRVFVNMDPDDGKFYDPDTGAVVTGARPIPPQSSAGGGQSRPMTDGQRANVIGSRRSQWTRFTKAILDRQQSVAKVDSGLAALARGNRNAATQIIITAFNKLQDEASVVREGEYARSEQLAPLTSRIEGAILRLTQGGGALNDAQLTALANEAKALSQALEKVSNDAAMNLRQGIEEELTDYGIPTSRVFGGSAIGVRAPSSATVGGGGLTKPSTGNPYGGGRAR